MNQTAMKVLSARLTELECSLPSKANYADALRCEWAEAAVQVVEMKGEILQLRIALQAPGTKAGDTVVFAGHGA